MRLMMKIEYNVYYQETCNDILYSHGQKDANKL
jgi:hypothetical protein